MSTRLYVNLSQVYMPMYIEDTLELHKVHKNLSYYFYYKMYLISSLFAEIDLNMILIVLFFLLQNKIAIIPLVIFISGFIASFVVKFLRRLMGIKVIVLYYYNVFIYFVFVCMYVWNTLLFSIAYGYFFNFIFIKFCQRLFPS